MKVQKIQTRNESTWMEQQRNKKQAVPVEYTAQSSH